MGNLSSCGEMRFKQNMEERVGDKENALIVRFGFQSNRENNGISLDLVKRMI